MFNLEIPINSLSFGQMGWGIAYEMFKRNLEPNIFPIGEVDLKSFKRDANFEYWLQNCCKKAALDYAADDPTFTLWHINGSFKRLTNKNALWTAYESSSPTKTEVNICNKFETVFFTSNYAKDSFEKAGLKNAKWLPNYFDEIHLKNLDLQYVGQKPITFGLVGKLEKRKNTAQILASWANLYGNKKEYQLICCIFNPFIHPEQQIAEINQIFGGQKPWNIELLPFTDKNSDFNIILDRIDIDISGLSGAEGWGLPCFNSLCLGKICVVLDAHAHKDYANSENSTLVEPSGKLDISDGRFFHHGAEFNQGDMFTISLESAQESFKKAVDKLTTCGKLDGRPELVEKFNVKNTVNRILEWVG